MGRENSHPHLKRPWLPYDYIRATSKYVEGLDMLTPTIICPRPSPLRLLAFLSSHVRHWIQKIVCFISTTLLHCKISYIFYIWRLSEKKPLQKIRLLHWQRVKASRDSSACVVFPMTPARGRRKSVTGEDAVFGEDKTNIDEGRRLPLCSGPWRTRRPTEWTSKKREGRFKWRAAQLGRAIHRLCLPSLWSYITSDGQTAEVKIIIALHCKLLAFIFTAITFLSRASAELKVTNKWRNYFLIINYWRINAPITNPEQMFTITFNLKFSLGD